jgi:hypothetical protein
MDGAGDHHRCDELQEPRDPAAGERA